MPYKVFPGTFRLYYKNEDGRHVGSKPDGDSIWFQPDEPDSFQSIEGRSVEYNKGGFVQLRFEAIDALEIHFQGVHQEVTVGKAGSNSEPDRAWLSDCHVL